MDDAYSFLNNLIGQWLLTGHMGEVELRQEITARWVLGNRYLEMVCKSITDESNPTSDYEAVYHIGFNETERIFVMHLLDTTEVPINCIVGLGRRQGNSIPFQFAYSKGEFLNSFTWNPEQESWSFQQTYEEGGETKTFATKQMTRTQQQV